MSYAIQLQPPPANTGMSLVTNVAGTTVADDAYWAEKCKTIPSNTLFIVLDMGAVRYQPLQPGNPNNSTTSKIDCECVLLDGLCALSSYHHITRHLSLSTTVLSPNIFLANYLS